MLPPGEFFSNIFIVSIVPIVAIIPIFLIDNLAVAMLSHHRCYVIASPLLCNRSAVSYELAVRLQRGGGGMAIPSHHDNNVIAA